MTLLFENPWPIGCIGGLLTVACALVAWSRRSLASLLALALAAGATLALLAMERWIVTPSEEVEIRVLEALGCVKANDVDGLLAIIDPSATNVRSDAETLMKLIQVDKCHHASTVRVELDADGAPPAATARFRGLLNGTVRQGGARAAFFDDVELRWEQREGQWRLVDYTAYEKGRPLTGIKGR